MSASKVAANAAPVHDRLRRTTIAEEATIRDAMVCINTGGTEIALVAGEDGRLLGTITDGDIRRALLSGKGLEDGIRGLLGRKPTVVGPAAGRAEVIDLMKARGLRQIPVVDGEGRLCGLHLLNDLLGRVERPNWAVIVAGGLGTRLMPLTEVVPKPMLPVAGRPILERIVLHLVGFGIREILIAVRHLADRIGAHFGDGTHFGCRIEYLRERDPLGTAGCLSLLPRGAVDPLVVMNGDLITQFDVGRMLQHHVNGGFAATVGVRVHGVRIPYGVVTAEGGRVVRMEEKPDVRCVVNSGIYVVEPAVAASVPKGVATTMPALLEGCIARGKPVGAFPIEEEWIDVGAMDELLRARGVT